MTPSRILALCTAAALVAGCHRDSNGVARHDDNGWDSANTGGSGVSIVTDSVAGKATSAAFAASGAPAAAAAPLAPGDVRIFSSDSAVQMSLIGSHIGMQLGDKVMKKVDTDMAKNADSGSGFGAMIANAVKGSVRNALSKDYGFPLSDVRDVNYVDGSIVFDWEHKPMMSPETMNVNNQKMLDSFSPADARRFVAAVKARLHSR